MSPPRSPASPATVNNLGIKMSPTPVTSALTTAKWLRNVISPLPSKPSQQLEHFLVSCDRDFTNDVTHRANVILEAIFPSKSHGDRSISGTLQNVTQMDSLWAEDRKSEALKLYYRVLEAMCRAESILLNATNLTPLLSHECFHRCMLACSAELVLATHKTVTIMFPDVLERTGITAFDLSKVIESYVRHEETLPRELKRHLNTFEEHLLESLAWEKGSSMYNSLIIARPSLSETINRLGLLADPMPSLDSITTIYNISNGRLSSSLPIKRDSLDVTGEIQSPKRLCTERSLVERNSFTSPVKSKLPHLQSAFATPTRPNPAGGGETYAETGIHIFFTKILKLAANRIKSLCEKMQLLQSPKIRERVYFLIKQILNQQTFLFFNRHIDQLVLCSFYGVAKISQLTLTFKEIINSYKKQPQCRPQVFRSVFIDWSTTGRDGKTGQEHVDIITFYNEVFIPSVKPLLIELGPGSTVRNNRLPEDDASADGQCPGSPRLSPFPNLPDMSPKKVSASHNVYVSPLRSSKMDTLLSPSSTSYYAFVGESTHAYQSPSKDLTAINNRLNSHGNTRGKLKLNFDMVSDSLVAGSLCPQNGNSTLNPIVKSEKSHHQS
ncbi:Retinoblastoma-related protein [Zostera marina]|uniref:Retinoblastoma-related protein n=1 Tax=Zostera marina TaxID=29655 RepID=A0A0K9Q5T2_ZOSMR|nr:Retinoblastoma-related protein [Zostera marina]